MHAADDQAAVLSSLRKINITEATFSPSPVERSLLVECTSGMDYSADYDVKTDRRSLMHLTNVLGYNNNYELRRRALGDAVCLYCSCISRSNSPRCSRP